jgi:hypothetical protein
MLKYLIPIILVSFTLGIFSTLLLQTYNIVPKPNTNITNKHKVFIWNDVDESLPCENSEIILEMYQGNDTIYIGPKQ